MRVGIAGLGKMGSVFAGRLIGAGHELAVWNRTPEKARAVNGARFAASPAELSDLSDIVLTIVSDDAAVKEVYEGPSGLLSGNVSGKLFVEMSTVQPATHVALAKAVEAAGGRFIECPVGGSVKVASEGGLQGFAGGDASDIDRAREVLSALCRRVERVGPIGAGAALKLAINLPLLVYWQALGEAVALCDGFGLDPAFMVEMFSESSGGPNTLKVRGPAIVKALGGEDVPSAAPVDTMHKDLGLMLAIARANNVESPLVERVRASYERARAEGLGDMDCTAFPAYWAKRGNRRR
jgi:3-hydroxyisobutyrate dehydrogenase